MKSFKNAITAYKNCITINNNLMMQNITKMQGEFDKLTIVCYFFFTAEGNFFSEDYGIWCGV